MKHFPRILVGTLALVAQFAHSVRAGDIYFATHEIPSIYMAPESTAAGIATAGVFTSGGHVDSEESPASSNGSLVLARSSIGFMAATAEGYAGSFQDATGAAQQLTDLSARYRFLTNPDGSLQQPVSEKTDGSFSIDGTTGQNAFDESGILEALDSWRLAIRLNPLNPAGYQGVARATRERMMARLVLAYDAYLDSARFRSLPPSSGGILPGGIDSPIDLETNSLLDARAQLIEALDLFVALARDPVEGIYLQLSAPYGLFSPPGEPLSPLADEASRIFETYVRCLALVTEIEERFQRMSYLRNYQDPLTGVGPAGSGPGSPAEIAARIDLYEGYLALIGGFSHCESFGYAPIGRVRSGLGALATLSDQADQALVTFTPGSRLGAASEFVQTAFSPFYVPFLTTYPGSTSQRTYENLLTLLGNETSGVLGDAITAEAEAASAAEIVISNEQTLKERTAETLIQYNGRLIELCGSYPGPDGHPVPDLQGYLFPRDIRFEVTGRQGTGAVAAQYARIEIAQSRYQAAVQDLVGLLQRIEITEQGAAERAGVARRTGQSLARIYTTYGEEFALLDKVSAEIQAQAERDAALAQAEAHKRGFLSKLGSSIKNAAIITGGILAAAALPITAPALAAFVTPTIAAVGVQGAVNEIENWSDFNKQGKAIIKAANIRSKSIEALGRINEQRTRLRAAESADVAIVSADGQAAQIELTSREEIRKLYVEMERAKLNILIAEQEVDLANLELANLFEKVGYLLDEYQEAVRQLAELPLNRPDFRYVRDYRLQFSEDQFRRAQMWTYLTLKSAQYRFMTTGTFNQVGDLIERTLKCRNATELNNHVVNALDTLGAEFYLGNDFAANGALRRVTVSLRDQIYQTNVVSRNAEGDVSTTLPANFMPQPSSYGATPETASDAQWLEILNDSITGMETLEPVLRLRFTTSFDPRGTNPLHNPLQGQLGHVILSSGGDGNRKGVFVNLKGRQIPGDNATYQVSLQQVGTTYLTYRSRTFNGSPNPAWSGTNLPVRTWSLPPRGAFFDMALNEDDLGAFDLSDAQLPKQSAFDERSPYCDQWVLTIDGSDFGSPNWELLVYYLDKIKDIRLGMTIQGFDPNQTNP
jgi:hypothetical protein